MSVVILGAGRRGARLARHLIEEKKSVIMIDWDNERCSQIMAKLDLMAICRSATDISVLEEAGAKEAEAIIAVTDSDEVNLVACGIAASNFPETKTIAAIRGISYLGKEAEHKGGRILGIDHIVNPEEEAAKRIAGIIKSGLFSDVIRFDDAEFILFTSYIQEGSMFQGKSLIEVKKMLDGQYVVIGIRRGKEVFSPSGGTVLMAGDELAVMAVDDDSDSIFSSFRGENSSIKLKKAFIVGGTRIARYLLRMMGKKTQERMVLIDKDSDICSSFAEEFPYLLVLNDSITDEEVWEDERLHNADLMISVTENDELNIITASYAKKVGTKKSIALLKTNPNYVQFATTLDIDVPISTTSSTVDTIMKHLRGESVKTLHSTFDGELEVYEYVLSPSFRLNGKKLMDTNFRGKCILTGVKRSEVESFVPDGNYIFRANDTVLVSCVHENYDFVMEMFGEH